MIDVKQVTDIEFEDIHHADHPDYCDAYISEATYNGIKFDSNVGWAAGGFNTAVQSWMWKRGQGCDVVTYDGLSGVREIPHSLAKPAVLSNELPYPLS